jgi:hypothetical protein
MALDLQAAPRQATGTKDVQWTGWAGHRLSARPQAHASAHCCTLIVAAAAPPTSHSVADAAAGQGGEGGEEPAWDRHALPTHNPLSVAAHSAAAAQGARTRATWPEGEPAGPSRACSAPLSLPPEEARAASYSLRQPRVSECSPARRVTATRMCGSFVMAVGTEARATIMTPAGRGGERLVQCSQ